MPESNNLPLPSDKVERVALWWTTSRTHFVRIAYQSPVGLRHYLLHEPVSSDSESLAEVRRYNLTVSSCPLRCFLTPTGSLEGKPLYNDVQLRPLQRRTSLDSNLHSVLDDAIAVLDALQLVHQSGMVHYHLSSSCVAVASQLGLDGLQAGARFLAVGSQVSSSFSGSRGGYTGELTYISPEATGRLTCPVDYRSDYYSFGVLLYELICGHPPFASADPQDLVYQHLTQDPPPLAQEAPTIPDCLASTVHRLLAKDPKLRHDSLASVRRELQTAKRDGLRASSSPPPTSRRVRRQASVFSGGIVGRQVDLSRISSLQEEARSGSFELLLVTGPSGIGKSELVQQAFLRARGDASLYGMGKFDFSNQGSPLSAWKQSIARLIALIIEGPILHQSSFKNNLQSRLGNGLSILCEHIPLLRSLFPDTKQIWKISNLTDNSDWLIECLTQLILAITATSEVCIICLDDIQWSDAASKQLLRRLLAQPKVESLLLVLCARDQELPEDLQIQRLRSDAKSGCSRVTHIPVQPLSTAEIQTLVRSTVAAPPAVESQLVSAITEHTQGNPFWVCQVLEQLVDAGRLEFSEGLGRWVWSAETGVSSAFFKGAVSARVAKHFLSDCTRIVLEHAACFGSVFSTRIIEHACDLGRAGLSAQVELAVTQNLIAPTESVHGSEQGEHYKFCHDRIQEIVLSAIPPGRRVEIHWSLSQALIRLHANNAAFTFAIANQLHGALPRIVSKDAKRVYLEYQLRACQLAATSGALETALETSRRVHGLGTPDELWQICPDVVCDLWSICAKMEELFGHSERGDELLGFALARESDPVRLAELYVLSVTHKALRADYAGAISIGLSGLGVLGFPLEKLDIVPSAAKLSELQAQLSALASRGQWPAMSDEGLLAAMRILVSLGPPSYRSDSQLWTALVCAQTEISIESGSTPSLGYSLPALAGILESRQASSSSTLALIESLTRTVTTDSAQPSQLSIAHLMLATSHQHWGGNWSVSERSLEEAFRLGVESGNYQCAAYAVGHHAYFIHYAELPWEEASARLLAFLEFARRRRNHWAEDVVEGVLLVARQLSNDSRMAVSEQEVTAFESRCQSRGNRQPLTIHRILSAEAHLCLGEVDEAASILASLEPDQHLVSAPGLLPALHLCWVKTLLLLWRPAVLGFGSEEANQHAVLELKKFRGWVEGQPVLTYLLSWLEAECLIASGQADEALPLLDRAVGLAKVRRRTRHGNALAARLTHLGTTLISKHQARRQGLEIQSRKGLSSLAPVSVPLSTRNGQSTQQPRSLDLAFDFDALLVAVRTAAVSRHLSEAIGTILRNVAKLSGAQKVLLLSHQPDSDWCTWDTEGEMRPLERGSRTLPVRLTDYVAKTRTVARVWSRVASPFSEDAYIVEHQPAAMVCLPLLVTNELHGLLYLEHRTLAEAFEEQRLKLVEFLASSGAIAIRNATLFRALQQDIEHRRQVEEELSRERNRLSALLEQSPHGLQVYNVIGELQSENPAAVAFYGRSPAGSLLAQHPAVGDAPSEVLASVLEGESVTIGDYLAGTGTSRWLHLSAYAVRTAGGLTESIVLMSEDITARKRAEQIKSEFISTVSHELRTPVTSIQGALRLISGGVAGELSPRAAELIGMAQRNGFRLEALVNDILDTERVEAGTLRVTLDAVNVRGVLSAVASTMTGMALARELNLVILDNVMAESLQVLADHDRLLQVLNNLVSNALKFSSSGSSVQVSVEVGYENVRFAVTDNGPGIPEEFRSQLFGRFARVDNSASREQGGTGLGLFISKGLVERMGGRLSFAPNSPRGCRFFVDLKKPTRH